MVPGPACDSLEFYDHCAVSVPADFCSFRKGVWTLSPVPGGRNQGLSAKGFLESRESQLCHDWNEQIRDVRVSACGNHEEEEVFETSHKHSSAKI